MMKSATYFLIIVFTRRDAADLCQGEPSLFSMPRVSGDSREAARRTGEDRRREAMIMRDRAFPRRRQAPDRRSGRHSR